MLGRIGDEQLLTLSQPPFLHIYFGVGSFIHSAVSRINEFTLELMNLP